MDATTAQTYHPDDHDSVASLRRLLGSTPDGSERSSLLLTTGDATEPVVIPNQVRRLLAQVVSALDEGMSVSVTPLARTVTTQQAADLLGVSRPTLVRLLDNGTIPFERSGSHRRLLLRDVLAHRERRRAAQLAAIDATSVPIDDEEDLQQALAVARQVRASLGAKRREGRGGTVGGA